MLLYSNIDIGITLILILLLIFVFVSVVTLISSGNLLEGIFKNDKAKVRDAMPWFVPSFLIFLSIIIFLLSRC